MYIQNHKLKRKPVFMEESLDAEHRGIVYVTINTFSDIHDHQSLLLFLSKVQTVHVLLITYCYILCHT